MCLGDDNVLEGSCLFIHTTALYCTMTHCYATCIPHLTEYIMFYKCNLFAFCIIVAEDDRASIFISMIFSVIFNEPFT